jgi:hypothetical protein
MARNQPTRTFRAAAFAAAISAALAAAMPAAAVQDESDAPPQPSRSLVLQSPIGGYAVMALAAAGLVAVSLMRSRRGAQD